MTTWVVYAYVQLLMADHLARAADKGSNPLDAVMSDSRKRTLSTSRLFAVKNVVLSILFNIKCEAL